MKIAFESSRDGNWEIYAMNADASVRVQARAHLVRLVLARRGSGVSNLRGSLASPGSTSSECGPDYVSDRGFGTPSWRQIAATVPGRISA